MPQPRTARALAQALLDFYVKGKHRWIQRQFYDDNDGYCLVGAACVLKNHDPSGQVFCLLARQIVGPSKSLVVWNDAPGRTRRQVLAALRKVAQS